MLFIAKFYHIFIIKERDKDEKEKRGEMTRMNYVERLKAVLEGNTPDRVPWSPNLAYWWQFQNPEFLKKGEHKVLMDFGCTPLIRCHEPSMEKDDWNEIRMYDTDYGECSIQEIVDGEIKYKEIKTPIGSLEAKYVRTPMGDTWFLEEHPIKTIDDYKIVDCLFENITLTPNYSQYEAVMKKYGEEVLFFVMLAPEVTLKSAYQSMLEFWVGMENLNYDIIDYPEIVENTIKKIEMVNMRAAEICAESPAKYFSTWEDSSTTTLSPTQYAQYIMPEIAGWCEILHKHGKKYIQHACGLIKNLLPFIAESGVDGIESITPKPMGDLTMKEAFEMLPKDMVLIGGIDASVMEQTSCEELCHYVENLLEEMRGHRFILANSDSCPPNVSHEKFIAIGKIVEKFQP